jgi:hypothetical protein
MTIKTKKKSIISKAIDPKDESVSQMRLMAMIALWFAIFITLLCIGLMKCIDKLTCEGIAIITGPFVVSAFAGKWLQKREEIKLENLENQKEEEK